MTTLHTSKQSSLYKEEAGIGAFLAQSGFCVASTNSGRSRAYRWNTAKQLSWYSCIASSKRRMPVRQRPGFFNLVGEDNAGEDSSFSKANPNAVIAILLPNSLGPRSECPTASGPA